MLTHGDWHDFTVSILECKEVMKVYRDHLYGLNIIILYCHIILYYTTFLLTKRCFPLLSCIQEFIYYYKNLYLTILKDFTNHACYGNWCGHQCHI